jgi:hypothetical protein
MGLLYDLNSSQLAQTEKPKAARSPKYDHRIGRSGGYQWASETDAESLKFWGDKAAAGVNDEKYGEKNAKNAKALSYWLQWRTENPTAIWTGERNNEQVTACAPSRKPELHEWSHRTRSSSETETPEEFTGDNDIPF